MYAGMSPNPDFLTQVAEAFPDKNTQFLMVRLHCACSHRYNIHLYAEYSGWWFTRICCCMRSTKLDEGIYRPLQSMPPLEASSPPSKTSCESH